MLRTQVLLVAGLLDAMAVIGVAMRLFLLLAVQAIFMLLAMGRIQSNYGDGRREPKDLPSP